MTRDESLDVVNMIASHWPGSMWTTATLDAYARAIEWMDPELAVKAVARAVNEMEFYPRVATLREFYGIEKRMAEPEPAIQKQATTPNPQKMPPWVCAWIVARVRHRDFRVFAEQDPRGHSGNLMPADARSQYIEEAGDLPIDILFNQAVGNV